MARDGSGTYTLPANTAAVTGEAISSTKFNTLVQDLEADANVDRPIAAGGTGASTASAARTNLGLGIGTDVQAFDAGLLSIAGLTTAADRSIYTTALDTYAVYTLTAAGRAILDDADAAAQRTTLGLGTSATVNTGTSGATIPLLNGANTWSAAQTISGADALSLSAAAGTARRIFFNTAGIPRWTAGASSVAESGSNAGSNYAISSYDDAGNFLAQTLLITRSTGVVAFSATPTAASNTMWHAGNDGAGSGLDADTVDGIQASALATLTGSETLTNKTLTAPVISTISNSGTITLPTGTRTLVARDTTDTLTNKTLTAPIISTISNTGTLTLPTSTDTLVGRATTDTLTNKTLTNPTINAAALSGTITGAPTFSGGVTLTTPTINGGTSNARVIASTETTGTLTAASANETIQATGNITINNSVFAAGDMILIYAGDTARTITQGTITTMRLGGTSTTGSRTLAARGVALLFFVSSSEVVVSGGAVT